MLFKMLISFLPSIIDFLKGGKLKRHAKKIFTEQIHNTINDFVVAYNVAYDEFIEEDETLIN